MHNHFRKSSAARAKNSAHIHSARTATAYTPPHPAKKISIFIIIFTVFVVIIATACAFIFKPENLVPTKISALAADYYENYFYENSLQNIDSADLFTTMQRYETRGFAPVSLRQLLLYDNQKNADVAEYLKTYCNENTTLVRFFPAAPYGKTDYHTEVTYSCNF